MDTSLDVPHACYLVQELNKQRLNNNSSCDYILVSNGQKFHAHKGVLAAVCPYFKTKFKTCFNDCINKQEEELPPVDPENVQIFMTYIYTGSLHLSDDIIEDTLVLADYFCIDGLKTKCGRYLLENLTTNNCLWVHFLADRFTVANVQLKVVDFMSPIFDEIVQEEEALSLPLEDLVCLLKEEQLIYVHEYLVWDLVVSWVKWDPVNRGPSLKELTTYLNPSFLNPQHLDIFLKDNDELSRILLSDGAKSSAIRSKQETNPGPTQDVIVIRSRQSSREDPVNMLMYTIHDDSWREMNYDKDWHGLQSMVSHDGTLYAISKTKPDMCGYMHTSSEKLEVVKVFPSGLVTLAAPRSLKGQTRLVSFMNDLIAVDSYGAVEIYEPCSNEWYPVMDNLSLAPCQYYLPMPFNQTLYLLRATCYSETQMELTLHEMDIKTRSNNLVSDCTTSDLNLNPDERYHGYTITSSAIFIQNEMGRPRIKYDLISQSWSSFPRQVPYLRCISEVWGSVSCNQSSYYVCRMSGSNTSVLLMYDYPSGKFKALAKPLYQLSGVMCVQRFSIEDFP